MDAERFAVLMFRFVGVFIIVGIFPTVATESIPILFWSSKFSIGAATSNDFLQFVYAVMLALQIVVAVVLVCLSKKFATLIVRGT
jgi:hypothetical protein